MPNPQRLMDMAANTAILGAFACEAPEVAAVIGIVQFALDVVWPAAQAPTQCAPVDHAYLKAAIDDLRAEITDALWNAQLDTHTNLVMHANVTYWGYLKQFQQMDANTDPASDKKLEAYFTDDTSAEYPLKDLDVAREFLEYDSVNDADLTQLQVAEHYTNNIGLYALIGSNMVTYLKTCVAFNRAKLMFPFVQYAKYQSELAKWNGYTAKQQNDHPEWKPAPVNDPNPTGKTPLMDWPTWIKRQESGVPLLITTVDTLVAYAEGAPAASTSPATIGLQVQMAQHWAQAKNNMQSRVNGIYYFPQSSRYNYAMHFDTANGLDSYHDLDPGPIWVVDQDASYPYVNYTVASGDTIASIAGSHGLMPEDVFFLNLPQFPTSKVDFPNVKNDTNYFKVGQVVKVPGHGYGSDARGVAVFQWWYRVGAAWAAEWEDSMARFALANVTEADITDFAEPIKLWKRARASVQFKPYTVVAGDTLASIAASQLQDATLAGKLYDFNRDTLKSPSQVLTAGQVINIPDKDVLSDI